MSPSPSNLEPTLQTFGDDAENDSARGSDADRVAPARAPKLAFIPTIGRIVHYTVTEQDAEVINRRRTTGASIADRLAAKITSNKVREEDERKEGALWPAGAQAHIGNHATAGDVYPLIITRVWGDTEGAAFNGQLLLDGTDNLWVTSTHMSEEPKPGFSHVPPRA